MRIFLVSEYLSNQSNGIAIRMENYIKYIKKFNHEIIVYGPPNCKSTDHSLIGFINPYNNESYISLFSFHLIYNLIFNPPDILHLVYPPCIISIFVLLIAKLRGVKIICSNHVNLTYYNNKYNHNYFTNRFFFYSGKFFYYQQILCANHIISPSISYDLETLFNYKTSIMSTGIDLDLFKYDPSIEKVKKSLLYVGRLAPEKNILKMIDFFKNIQNNLLHK